MPTPESRHSVPDASALALLQHVLQQLGTAAGLVDHRGQWLFMSEAMRNALDTGRLFRPMHGAQGPSHGLPKTVQFLTRKAVNCIRNRHTDIHWLKPMDPAKPTQAGGVKSVSASSRTQRESSHIAQGLVRLAPLDAPADSLCLLTLHEAANNGEPAALQDMIDALRRQTMTDPLTGLYNRRWVMEEALTQMSPNEEAESDTVASLMLLDLDHFKSVNDRHGHLTGDQVLQIVSSRLLGLVRAGDSICRYGGEEFLILLPHTRLESAVQIAERMRQQIAAPIDCLPAERLTASVGISPWNTLQEALDEALQRADDALYAAKAAGRDCVRI